MQGGKEFIEKQEQGNLVAAQPSPSSPGDLMDNSDCVLMKAKVAIR